ncbi:unnamed protein product [Closterium sp. Naga37s-1]|nr:unnamed protein product [Closterium sp. Naga37s-1]
MGSAGSRSADKSWNLLRPKIPSRHSDSKPHSRPINRPRRPSLTIPSSDDSFPPRPSPGGGYGAAGYGAGHGAGHGGGYGGGYGGASLGENGYPGNNDDNVRHDANLPNPVEFSYEELVTATDGFSAVNVLGEGGYGKVYRGVVREEAPDGSTVERHVAVKQLNDEGRQGFNEWLTEVVFLRRLRHPHLVQFVGYCTEKQQALLVYELMANASLDYHLFDDTRPPLTWQQRVNVALGAAKGLAYLHEGTERQVIFRDLKAANILLDENFNAKLSDFGLAKDGPAGENTHVSTMVVGTYGYTAPEYLQTGKELQEFINFRPFPHHPSSPPPPSPGHLTSKSDVCAFGVVLLELLSGRRAVDIDRPGDEKNLVFWAKPFLADRKRSAEIVDPRLQGKHHQFSFPSRLCSIAPPAPPPGHLTAKSDVYAFGVVLLELLSGRRAVDIDRPGDEKNLVFWAKPFLADRKRSAEIVDPRLQGKHHQFSFPSRLCSIAPPAPPPGHLTAKSDVYAFGVVLLELLSGRRAVDIDRPGDEKNLVFWAKPFLADRKRSAEIVDPRLQGKHHQFSFPSRLCSIAPPAPPPGHLTAKSDVYAFGVVLLELLSGRRAVDIDRPGDEKNLVFWAKPFLADRKRIGEIVDPRLQGRFSHKGALKLAVAAHCCLQDAKSRPSMADMVQTLTALMEMGEGAAGGGSGRGGDTPRTPRTPRTPKTAKTPTALKTTNTLKPLGSAGGAADTPVASRTPSAVSGDGANSARTYTGGSKWRNYQYQDSLRLKREKR